MMLVNPNMKDKYPYWYAMVEKEQQQRQIDEMMMIAQIQLSQFVDTKIKEIDDKVRDIENRLHQASFNIEANINNQPISNNVINREIKKMVVNEIEKALR